MDIFGGYDFAFAWSTAGYASLYGGCAGSKSLFSKAKISRKSQLFAKTDAVTAKSATTTRRLSVRYFSLNGTSLVPERC